MVAVLAYEALMQPPGPRWGPRVQFQNAIFKGPLSDRAATRRQNSDPGWISGLGERIRVIRVGRGVRDSRWVARVGPGWAGSGRVGSLLTILAVPSA
jgi:hypothetical protein